MSCRSAPKRSAVAAGHLVGERLVEQSARRPPARSPAKRSRSASTSSVRSSTASVWPWTSRWWLGPCSTPRSAASSGRTTGGQAELVEQRRGRAAGRGRASSRRSSASWRSPAGSAARAASARRQRQRCRDRPRARARRRAGRRAAGAAGRRRSCRSPTARRRRRSRSARPPWGSIGSPPASGTATAPTVKSRAPRSASIVSPRSAVDVDLPAAVAVDRPPGRELGRELEGVPAARPRDRLRGRRPGSPATARSRSVDLAAQGGVAHGAAGDPGTPVAVPERVAAPISTTGAAASRPATCRQRCLAAGTRAEIPQVTS